MLYNKSHKRKINPLACACSIILECACVRVCAYVCFVLVCARVCAYVFMCVYLRACACVGCALCFVCVCAFTLGSWWYRYLLDWMGLDRDPHLWIETKDLGRIGLVWARIWPNLARFGPFHAVIGLVCLGSRTPFKGNVYGCLKNK